MTGVAKRLDVDHSSLYRHVGGRAELLLAAADLAIAGLRWRNRAGHWRPYLETIAVAVWRLYQRHPGLADVIRTLDVTPPSGIRAFAETTARLEGFGFARSDAILVLDSIMDMTVDSALGWPRLAGKGRTGKSVGERLLASWTGEAQASRDFSAQIGAMAGIMTGDPEEWWRRKLGLLLDGAEMLLREESR